VKPVRVDVDFELHGNERTMNRRLQFDGEPEGAQRARLAEIAERTPVTLTLKQGVTIATTCE
jgi:putative redox protein